jgi:hypothetical protein
MIQMFLSARASLERVQERQPDQGKLDLIDAHGLPDRFARGAPVAARKKGRGASGPLTLVDVRSVLELDQ